MGFHLKTTRGELRAVVEIIPNGLGVSYFAGDNLVFMHTERMDSGKAEEIYSSAVAAELYAMSHAPGIYTV